MIRLSSRLWVVWLLGVVVGGPRILWGQEHAEYYEPAVEQRSTSQNHAHYYEPAPKRWRREWYEEKSFSPVGARQWFKFGKLWPPWPRPAGEPQEFSHKFHATHYWPYPYVCQDRHFVRSIMERQVTNGWVTATTLYHYHFDPGSHELNHAGRLHLRWILHEAPEKHRLAFVQSAAENEVSQERMASVRKTAASLVGDGNVPPIMLRFASPMGRPGAEIVNIRRAELSTQPAPRIPFRSSTASGGGYSPAGSGSGM